MANLNFGKGIPLTSGFDLGAKLPLDTRVVVETYDDLEEHVKKGRAFIGLVAYVKDRDENYQYTGSGWTLFGRGSVSTTIVDTYESIAGLENIGEGALIYVKSDSNKNDEENMYVVTESKVINGITVPTKYVALSTFAKSLVPTLKYDESLPEGKKIYFSREEDFVLKFFFSSDSYGDGKYKIYKNGALIRSFNAAKGNVLVNLGKFDTNGQYSIEVSASDYFGVPAPKNLIYNIIVGGLELASTFDETLTTAIYEIGDTVSVPYIATVSDKDQKIKTVFTVTKPDGTKVTDIVDTETYEVSSTWSNKEFFNIRGLYSLDVQAYTGTSLDDTTEGTFISNKLSYKFRILQAKEIGIISEFDTQVDTNTYVSIPFKLTRKNTAFLTMRGTVYQKKDGNWVEYAKTEDTGQTAGCNTVNYWSIGRVPEGEYKYELWGYTTDFQEKSIDPAIAEFLIVQSSYQPVLPVSTNLIAWFDANDRRNGDAERHIWKNKTGVSSIPLGDTYRIELHNLNYDDNGWKNIDGLADNVNGEFALKMNGQSWGQLVKVNVDGSTTPYSPFSVFSNSGQSGITIETAIKTRCNGDLNAKVLTCMDGNSSATPGVSIGFNQFYMSSLRQPMSMDFMEDEWVHVAFVVDKEIRNLYGEGGVGQENIEDLNQVRSMRIYINGVLCSCTTFALNDTFLDAAGNSFPLMLNACHTGNNIEIDEDGNEIITPIIENFGDSEIKFIRIYNRPLKSSDVVNNYVAHIYDQDEQQRMKDRNDTSIVSLPTVIFKRNTASTNKNNFDILHAITDKATSKKTCVDCIMEFHDVDGNITVYENMEVYLQGTSSLQYPVKNYQLKHYDKPTGESDRKKLKFVPPVKENDWVPDSTYTLKVDYMEQSHRNNTPTAVFYDQVIDALEAASPARKDGYRDSIDGFPCVVYYDNNPGGADSKEVLVGSFMFNIDKEGKELGFECEVKDDAGNPLENKCISYEGTANTSDTAGCFFALGDNIEKVYNYYIEDAYDIHLKANNLTQAQLNFDSFKEQVNSGKLSQYQTFEQYSKDYTEIDYIISDFEARYSYCEDDEEATYRPMVDLVNWVSGCWEKQDNGEFVLNKTKFKSEFETHFDMKYMLAYYLQMQVFAQVDNCGKNCMWDTWDGIKFYPRPYDMDTEMGLSNTGSEIIRSDAEIISSLSPTKAEGHTWAKYSNSNTDGEDRYLMFNTKTSRLWNAFADVYADLIATTYIQLRNSKVYSVENIMKTIDAMTIDVIGEVYYNKDAASKYLALTTETTSEFLTMLHGNRQQKYKRFLTERITFLDTIYEYTWAEGKQEDTLNSETRMRSDAAFDINTGKTETIQCHLGIAVYSPQYVTISVGSGKDAVVTAYVSPRSKYIDPNTGFEREGTLFSFPVQGTNKEIGIFGSGNIKRIDRLETLDLTSISAERLNKILALNLSGSTRLSVLGLGQNTYLRELDCSRAMNLGTADEGKTLDISNCKNLQNMDVSVTKITGVNFPRNTNLITCDLSYTNVTSVKIDGAEFLTDIRITGCEDISDFTLNRCNKLEVLNAADSAIKNCKATNCSILKKVDVSRCSQLQTFDVSNSDMVEELVMTGNSGNVMKDLQLYSLYNLKKLVVNNSTTLNTIRLPKHKNIEEAAKGDAGEPWKELKYLDVRNSTIKKIQYGSSDINNEICDMSKLVNLEELYFSGASAVTNIENLTYTAINGLNGLFSGCFNLKRVSGTIKTAHHDASSIFYRCHLLSDINDLTFDFKNEDGQPCITTCSHAFYRCARATSAMIKKLLDACGSSLTNANYLIYMWGVDVNTTRAEAVIGTAADRPLRDIPHDLFANTPNIISLDNAFTETHYTTVPGTLFDPIKNKIQNLSQTFCHMDKLVTVGKDLLKNKPSLQNCYGMFAKCTELKNYINEDPEIFKGSSNITSTNQMFFNCSKMIVGSNGINKLFDPLTKVTTIEFMFYGCSSMNMGLSNGLFAKNTSLRKMDAVFANCSKIQSIPDRLFRINITDTNNLSQLTQARNVFGGCSGIKGTVKKNFFDGASKLVDIGYSCDTAEVFSGGGLISMSYGFFGNTNLEGYHEEILYPLTEITNISRLFYHSSANSSLKYCYHTGSSGDVAYLNSISYKIFNKNKSLRDMSAMFQNNTGLNGHIPSNLFEPCKSTMTSVSHMFSGCNSLSGTDYDDNDSSGLKNVGISNKWFLNAKSLTNANGFLQNCSGFLSSEIPADIFKGCTSLAHTASFFNGCTSLTCNIPRGLFDSCRSTLIDVSSMFAYCKGLTGSIPTGEYSTVVGVIGYEIVNKGTEGSYQVVIAPTDFNTQISYEQVILTSPNLEGQISSNGASYVKPVKGNITRTVQPGLLSNCLKLQTTAYMFHECQSITGSIPFDIFYTESAMDRYLNLTNVSYMFSRLLSLNTPYQDVTGVKYLCNEDLFAKCPAITNISHLFYYISKMPACNIYPNLFRNQSQITDASYLFQFTYNLTGAVTQQFLSSCLGKLQYANHMFCLCNMTSVNPNFLNLGQRNSILKRVGCIFHGNFDQASNNNAGTSPKFWDKSLFPNIESSEVGYQHALAGCTKLTNYNEAAQVAEGTWVSSKSH